MKIDPISDQPIWWDELKLPFVFLGFEIGYDYKSGDHKWIETKVLNIF